LRIQLFDRGDYLCLVRLQTLLPADVVQRIVQATIALNPDDEPFWIRVSEGNLTMVRGEIERPDVTLDTDPTTLLSKMQTDRSVDDALAAGDATISGKSDVIKRFFSPVSVACITTARLGTRSRR
jgi:hypothetical protein